MKQSTFKKLKYSRKGLITIILVMALIGTGAIAFAGYKSNQQAIADLQEEKRTNNTNDAGGQIDDIDWDTIIAYDADGNPIYKSIHQENGIVGYDMFGAPIYIDDWNEIGEKDGLPVIGTYSSIEQAEKRGKDKGNSDINWERIVGYDVDHNPIYASVSNNPNIIGYDAAGNPIYITDAQITNQTYNGSPVYNYSIIEKNKEQGKLDASALTDRMNAMTGEITSLKEQLAYLKQNGGQTKEDTDKYDSLQEQLDAATKRLKELEAKSGDDSLSDAEKIKTESEIKALLDQINSLTDSLKDTQSDIAARAKEAQDTKKALDKARSDLSDTQGDLDDTKSNVDSLTDTLNAKEKEIETLKKGLSDTNSEMEGLYNGTYDPATNTVQFAPYKHK